MRVRRHPALLLAGLALLQGCGDDDDDATPVADAGADAPEEDAALDAGGLTVRLEIRRPGTEAPIDSVLFADPFDVAISEAPPDTDVTLRAHRRGWASLAVLRTDADGNASTRTSASTAGTYLGVEPDGIVWSMTPVPDEEPDLGGTMDFEVEIDGHLAARTVLTRLAFIEGVQFVDVDDPAIVGTLYLPPGEGPFPGLLVFGGSEGGTFYESIVGPYFASKGFATLGVAYFGVEGVPPELDEIPLEYFDDALSWLGARPEVRDDRFGVLGASRGGELALLLGATFPSVHAVVAMVPSGVVWPGIVGGGAVPAWTLAGEPLPYIPPGGLLRTEPGPGDSTMYVYRPAFEESLEAASDEVIAAATIHVEATAGAVLMLSADDDQVWPSCTLAAIAEERLAVEHTQTFHDEHVCYPEAGHGISLAGFPAQDKLLNPDGETWTLFGGTPRGNGRGSRDALDRARVFLSSNLGVPEL